MPNLGTLPEIPTFGVHRAYLSALSRAILEEWWQKEIAKEIASAKRIEEEQAPVTDRRGRAAVTDRRTGR